MNATSLGEWEGRPVDDWRLAWRVPRLIVLTTTTSTNDVARLEAAAGAAAGTCVLAEAQSHGRGRAGRGWVATPGSSLLLSIVLFVEAGDGVANDAGVAPIRVGLAVASAIRRVSGLDARIKWPNDVVLAGVGKIAGILCEATTHRTHAVIIAGIGVNVHQQSTDFPASLRGAASSLRLAGAPVQRSTLAGAVIDALRPFRLPGGPLDAATLERWASLDALTGTAITVDGTPAGTVRGIAPDGSLVVNDGSLQRHVRTGTVRPAVPHASTRARP